MNHIKVLRRENGHAGVFRDEKHLHGRFLSQPRSTSIEHLTESNVQLMCFWSDIWDDPCLSFNEMHLYILLVQRRREESYPVKYYENGARHWPVQTVPNQLQPPDVPSLPGKSRYR